MSIEKLQEALEELKLQVQSLHAKPDQSPDQEKNALLNRVEAWKKRWLTDSARASDGTEEAAALFRDLCASVSKFASELGTARELIKIKDISLARWGTDSDRLSDLRDLNKRLNKEAQQFALRLEESQKRVLTLEANNNTLQGENANLKEVNRSIYDQFVARGEKLQKLSASLKNMTQKLRKYEADATARASANVKRILGTKDQANEPDQSQRKAPRQSKATAGGKRAGDSATQAQARPSGKRKRQPKRKPRQG